MTDSEKQKTFNLFLGEFVPKTSDLTHNLWDEFEDSNFIRDRCQCRLPALECIFSNYSYEIKGLEYLRKVKIENVSKHKKNTYVLEEDEYKMIEEEEPLKEKETMIDALNDKFQPSHFNFASDYQKFEENLRNFEFVLKNINNDAF